MEALLSLLMGIGLSAACGFRIFVPLLITSIASLSGHVSLSPSFEWIGSYYAFAAFAIATVVEIGAFYIPVLDHALDAIGAPVAIIAGTVITASFILEMSPFLKWGLAVIAGGGVAGTIHSATAIIRVASTSTTAGVGNFVVSTAEAVGSIILSVLAITLPMITVVVVLGLILFGVKKMGKRFFKKNEAKA